MVAGKVVEHTSEESVSEEGSALNISDLILGAGFVCMLAWHYLVLFSPVFGDLADSDFYGYLFERQLVLYLSLCVTFGVVFLMNRNPANRGKHAPSPSLVYMIGSLSVVVSGVYAFVCAVGLSLVVRLILVAGLGVCEAVFMFLWLRCFVNKRSERFLRSFALDMIIGALLAVLICYLTWPVAPIVAALIPGVSAFVLGREARLNLKTYLSERGSDASEDACAESADGKNTAADQALEASESARGKHEKTPAERLVARRNFLMALFVAVYALAFGLLQGSFISTELPVLMVDNAAIMVGIAFAGVVIYLVPKNLNPMLSIDVMHRTSLIAFIIGAVAIAWFKISIVWLYVAQIALLAGFNLFDFGALVYGIEEGRAGHAEQARVVHQTRAIVYVCLTVGLLIGYVLFKSSLFASDLIFGLVVVCGIAIIVLVMTTLVPFYSLDDNEQEAQLHNNRDERCENCSYAVLPTPIMLPPFAPAKPEVPEDWESPWRAACKEIASRYQLSPRETEIFFLVAKGRNADYIQQELVISTHTAKTHIANIYRKLEVHSSQELLDLVEETRSNTD